MVEPVWEQPDADGSARPRDRGGRAGGLRVAVPPRRCLGQKNPFRGNYFPESRPAEPVPTGLDSADPAPNCPNKPFCGVFARQAFLQIIKVPH